MSRPIGGPSPEGFKIQYDSSSKKLTFKVNTTDQKIAEVECIKDLRSGKWFTEYKEVTVEGQKYYVNVDQLKNKAVKILGKHSPILDYCKRFSSGELTIGQFVTIQSHFIKEKNTGIESTRSAEASIRAAEENSVKYDDTTHRIKFFSKTGEEIADVNCVKDLKDRNFFGTYKEMTIDGQKYFVNIDSLKKRTLAVLGDHSKDSRLAKEFNEVVEGRLRVVDFVREVAKEKAKLKISLRTASSIQKEDVFLNLQAAERSPVQLSFNRKILSDKNFARQAVAKNLAVMKYLPKELIRDKEFMRDVLKNHPVLKHLLDDTKPALKSQLYSLLGLSVSDDLLSTVGDKLIGTLNRYHTDEGFKRKEFEQDVKKNGLTFIFGDYHTRRDPAISSLAYNQNKEVYSDIPNKSDFENYRRSAF
jgi:hypothetical protein